MSGLSEVRPGFNVSPMSETMIERSPQHSALNSLPLWFCSQIRLRNQPLDVIRKLIKDILPFLFDARLLI